MWYRTPAQQRRLEELHDPDYEEPTPGPGGPSFMEWAEPSDYEWLFGNQTEIEIIL